MKAALILGLAGGLVLILGPAAACFAQQNADDLEAMRMQIQENRRALVAENLILKEPESEDFWRVYEEFHSERDILIDRRIILLREFRDNFDGLDEKQSTRMLDEYFQLEADLLLLRERYLENFRKVLSAKDTLRYYQIERKMDSIIEYDLSQIVPLAQ